MAAAPLRRPAGGSAVLRTQVAALGGRSVTRLLRQPAMVVPSIVFPLFLLAVNSGGLDSATDIPGFPTDSYITFALGFTFIQAAIFATMNAGQTLAQDIENGFFNRLSLTPMRGAALLAGQLIGLVVLGLIQTVVYLAVGLAAGAHLSAGIAGVPVLAALVVLICVGFGGLGMLMAIRSGSGEAVQGMFPLLFVLLFFSSMALPRDLIQEDWFRTLATINPVSYLIEALRSLLVTGWDGEALALGFGIAGALTLVSITAAAAALKGRMTRS